MKEKKEIPGEILTRLDKDIASLVKFIKKKFGSAEEGYRNELYGEPLQLMGGFEETTLARLHELRRERERHLSLKENTPPPPEALRCPHCGYNGEFHLDETEISGIGFRILEPILEPRQVLGYDGTVLTLSDTDERFDPFDLISEPGHVDCLDNNPDQDEVEAELRTMLRGRRVFVCGNEKCLKYFDARPFITKAHIEYPGTSAHKTKWRQ